MFPIIVLAFDFFAGFAIGLAMSSPTLAESGAGGLHANGSKMEAAVNLEMPVRGEQVSIVGIYETAGNGVECPKVRTDDGRLFGVSSIPTDVVIGARVQISGPYVVMTTCLGDVIFVEGFAEVGN